MSAIQQSEYRATFSAKKFLRMYYSTVETSWVGNFRKRVLKDFFKKYSSKWEKESGKLLDFGGGPVILNYISAAPHVAEIVHAAHTEGEQQEIELWKNNNEGAHDWNLHIKHVVSKIEGLEGDTAWQERVEMIRSKIRVVGCNIYDPHPISPTQDQNSFSVICTSFSLESACKTYDDFKAGIKKLVKLLKLGGYLVILLFEEETFYFVGEEKWHVLPVSLDQLKEAVKETGCVILLSEREPAPMYLLEKQTFANAKACVFLAAYKVRDS